MSIRHAAVNGTILAYTDSGPQSATPIVFSHSLFFDHSMFDELAAHFTTVGFRVITYDHRNQGQSASASRDELSVDRLTEDAAALIEHLALGRCHFAGNSLGGFVALRLASRRPDLLLTATALGSSAEAEHRLADYVPLFEILRTTGPAAIIEPLMHMMFGDTSLASRNVLCRPWREFMQQLPPSIADSAYGVIHRPSIVDELSNCQIPVLAVAGSEDHAYPQPISGRHIAAASGGQEVTIEGAGHSVSLERAEIVADHLTRHFTDAS